jgi:hypothetical protein
MNISVRSVLTRRVWKATNDLSSLAMTLTKRMFSNGMVVLT